jgi:hypothetical protein
VNRVVSVLSEIRALLFIKSVLTSRIGHSRA